MRTIFQRLLDPRVSLGLLAFGVALMISVPLGISISSALDGDEKASRPALPPLDYDKAIVQSPEDAPPTPPLETQWINKDGTLRFLHWDDRHISEEERLANPSPNPRWEPFARCMEAAGYEVRSVPGEPVLQDDLDALVTRLNASGPLITVEGGKWILHYTSEKRAYIDCVNGTIGLFSEDLYKVLTQPELDAAIANGDAPANSPPAQGPL